MAYPVLPPLHVKLGIVKNVVKAIDKNGEDFRSLKRKFPSFVKLKSRKEFFKDHKTDN